MSTDNDGGMILTGENRKTRRKTCPSAPFSNTNPTLIDPGANPGLRGERPATNRLSHGVWVSSATTCERVMIEFRLPLLFPSLPPYAAQQQLLKVLNYEYSAFYLPPANHTLIHPTDDTVVYQQRYMNHEDLRFVNLPVA
jgi:hypothetical protein